MPIRFRALAAALFVIAVVAGCSSSSGGTAAPASQAPAASVVAPSAAPAASVAAPSAAPAASAAASGAASSGATVEAKPVGSIGTVLVAGANGMTVYNFTKDVKDSGSSNCTGSCITTWPALTVASGAKPSAGAGVSGKLGTIKRDDGTTQVTYNGLPLYFFANDHAPGDANGVYQFWEAVKP